MSSRTMRVCSSGRALRGAAGLILSALTNLTAGVGCSSYEGSAPNADEGLGRTTEALSTTTITEAGDDQRTGHYGNQPRLSPSVVSGSTFGQLFSATVSGQVYAQPLVSKGTLFVVTESNDVYGLDPESGAERWHRNVGTPFNPATLGCNDLTPNIGITGTPVIDSATNVAYFFAKTTQAGVTQWLAHAVDVASGAEKPNFPVLIQGAASNAPGRTFDAIHHLQRPGLLLLGGKVYAAFGGHCDAPDWQGWVVGVSTDGSSQTRWVANTSGNGAGIWQSGGGIMSDGAGRMFVSTGNGEAPVGPILGSQAGSMSGLGEAIVRLDVQTNGSLRAGDFFAPYDAQELDGWDADFASGAPVALPDSFGTTAYPHLLVAVGKQGYVYLLNRDSLGGIGTGPNGGDAYVFRSDANGGVWSKPAVWPGDGGYVYIPTASGGGAAAGSSGFLYAYRRGLGVDGKPTLDFAGRTTDAFGFSSSRPIVTSDGLTAGTGIVWIVWSPGGSGAGSQLRAYRAVPNAKGAFDLLFQAPVGQSAKFNPPGVGDGRVYVGTRDGHVLGFGSPITPVLTATPAQFGNTVVGRDSTVNITLTAAQPLTIQNVLSSSPEFIVGPVASPTLAAGATTTVPITFRPTSSGLKGASVIFTTSAGTASTSLSGKGLSSSAELALSAPALSFGGTTVGGALTQQLVLSNAGATPLTLQGFTSPTSPFSAAQLPAPGTQLAPDASLTLTLQFAPTALGNYASTLGIQTSAGNTSVPLSGNCALPGHLSVTPLSVDYGRVAVSGTRWAKFEVRNTGGVPLTITKSKPPVLGPFTATTELSEGTVLGVNESLTEWVAYTPPAQGSHDDVWVLNSTGDNGLQEVALHGAAVPGGATSGSVSGWRFNGSAIGSANSFVLTGATEGDQTGSAFWSTALSPAAIDLSFDAILGGGSGADGLALVFADASQQGPTALGGGGGGLGFLGIRGVALALDTYQNGTDPSANFVGLTDGPVNAASQDFNWLATSSAVPALRGDVPVTHHVRVYNAVPGATPSVLVVELDGTEVIRQTVTLPPSVYVGFSGANGGLTDLHAVSNVSIVNQLAPGTGATSVLGFENPSQWSVSSGTVTASTPTTQGSSALAISRFYYTELVSTPVSNVGPLSGTLAFDFRPPASLSYGNVQLYVDAPSAGLFMVYVGQVSVAGAQANTYRTLNFAVPSNVSRALGGNYTDLRFKIAVNAPWYSSPYLFDNLRFVR
ncbi:MAG TPA: choice-of-anchor D domain-containing protein [Polyangiaceae bacterium]|nr:choice-of-anchor D domain-containing protein [Polyangiaceae bacterium]